MGMVTNLEDRVNMVDDALHYAQQIFQEASRAEPVVTADLQMIGVQTSANLAAIFTRDGISYSTLDTRLKSVASIESKILRDMRDGLSAMDVAENIRDDLRYTFVLDSENYGSGVASIAEALTQNSYRPMRIKDFWQEEQGYAGINSIWETPGGKSFEVQFHTQRSLEIKEVASHDLYEQLQSAEPNGLEAAQLDREITYVWSEVRANPPSMVGLDDAKRLFPRGLMPQSR